MPWHLVQIRQIYYQVLNLFKIGNNCLFFQYFKGLPIPSMVPHMNNMISKNRPTFWFWINIFIFVCWKSKPFVILNHSHIFTHFLEGIMKYRLIVNYWLYTHPKPWLAGLALAFEFQSQAKANFRPWHLAWLGLAWLLAWSQAMHNTTSMMFWL